VSNAKTLVMSRLCFGVLLLGGATLALVVLGPAAASSQIRSTYGGTLVVGLSRSDPPTLDPTVSKAAGANEIFLTMCLRLYELDAKQQNTPVLAAALPVLSKDKLSYTVRLRQGVLFNDGTPFNAQAVVATYQRYVTYPGSSRRGDFASVASVAASGPYSVVFHLNARDSTFTGNMYVLSPTAVTTEGDGFAAHPVCAGPFMFDNRVLGDHITVIKSPYYWDKGDVHLDKIVFKPLTEASAAAAALQAGDIQALDAVSSTQVQALQQTPGLRVMSAPQLAWQGVVINIGNRNGAGDPPYSNVGSPLASSAKLRQAFEEAIDRNALNRVVFGGLEQPSCTPIPPADTAWYDATKIPCTPYNPQDAKKLVAAAGIPNPTVHLSTTNAVDILRLAEFIQAQEAAVGITVTIDSTDSPTLQAREASGNFDAALFGFAGDTGDPNTVIGRFLLSTGESNYSGYSSPRLDLILSNGVKSTNIQARSTLYRVAQEIVASDRPIIFLYDAVTSGAFSSAVTGVGMTANGLMTVASAQFR
jgi:peptide/nickel transport system substrate-binding protein